ncbi:exodeoxyribonuclease VII large subunit [Actinomycetaceae bacterium MB13-C1-2]|nr:exodeoxyribonuclease VII large subunit [Actinomycetaceae bacterium MB13-C1-2]
MSGPVETSASTDLPATAAETSADQPWPLRVFSAKLKTHVERAPETWVEGQVVQYKRRGATQMSFFTLRDTDQDISMDAATFAGVLDGAGPGFDEGARVVARVKPSFFERSGRMTLRVHEIRLQGLGSLLAQIEKLRQDLAAEGLFDLERKKPLPMFPRRIGLICGKDAKAKDDVIVNGLLRWEAATFEVREVLVQGPSSALQVSEAIAELDAHPEVDVIVVARGGGSTEDLLPFSDERLVRVAAGAATPIVSAIGHEGDAPLLDLVSDYRASTPTDAAMHVTPDICGEKQEIAGAQGAMRAAVVRIVGREREFLSLLTSRPVLQKPTAVLDQQLAGLEQAQLRINAAISRLLTTQLGDIERLSGMLQALSPLGTLERGYSIIRLPDKAVVRSVDQLSSGTLIEGMLSEGTFVGQVVGTNKVGSFINPEQP